jgi:hypothetical protein
MAPPQQLAFPPSALRGVTAGGVLGNEIGSSGTRGKVLSSAQLKAIVEASGISYLPLSGGTLTGALTGTSLTLAQGSLQSGGLSFGGGGGANIYGRGQQFVFGTANVKALEIAWDYTRVSRESWIGWSDGSYDATNNTVRVSLFADAVGTLSQRNGLNAQCFDLFETYTSGTNNGKLRLKATSSGHQIGSARATSGSNRAVQLGHFDSNDVFTSGLSVATNGDVTCAANLNAGLNLRTGIGAGIYALSGVNAGAGVSSSADGILLISNFFANNFNRMQLGGTTSVFPSIKRSGAAVAFRLADDSADAAVTCAAITASGSITPATLTDAAASNGSIYYSSTQSKLVYKNSGGTVNPLY